MKLAAIDISSSTVTPLGSNPHFGQGNNSPITPKSTRAQIDNPTDQEEFSTVPADHILIGKIEGANDQLRSFAQQIRAVDKTMELVGESVQNMKASLEGVLKIYPPYPIESAERIQALRQFASLRKQIDQLTVPPSHDSPAKILGDSKMFSQAGDWQLPIGDGKQVVTIGRQPIHSGPDGLDLPELAPQASDASLRQALDAVTKSGQTLEHKRKGFIADANRVMSTI